MADNSSFIGQVRGLPSNFWAACFMEILERLAFFGVRAIAPLYLVASANKNGLGLDFGEKGDIYFIWALIQCLLPMVSGGYTDRYGYRKSLAIAFVINILGYCLMANAKAVSDHLLTQGWENPGYWVFMLAACMVATGTAIFKPPAQGTVAKSTDEETPSLGWGIFYETVNIGGALAPMGAAILRAEIRWDWVFYAAAIVTALNFLPAFLWFREPEREESDRSRGPLKVFGHSMATIFTDLRLVCFLLLSACFWLMFMQLWDLLPNFIEEWVNTSDVAPYFGWVSDGWVTKAGQAKPEMIINIDAISIILLVIPISWMIRRMNKIGAMVLGMLISLVGFVGTGATSIGWFCCLMVFVFSIGEMICSPTFNAYVGLIAPPDKKALYMGYSNIPFAIGWATGSKLSGELYERLASKVNLARQYLVEHLGMTEAFVADESILPKDRVMEVMTVAMQADGGAAVQQRIEVARSAVDWDAIPKDELSAKAAAVIDQALGIGGDLATRQATQVLWDLHEPYRVWYYLGGIGLAGTIGMILFYFATRRK